MDVIPTLVKDCCGGHPRLELQPDAQGNYVLVVDQSLLLNLKENTGSGEIAFYGSPGYLPGAAEQLEPGAPWLVRLRDSPRIPQAKAQLRICPQTELVLIVLTIDRAQLHGVNFRAMLYEFVSLYRAWAEVLHDAPAVSEAGSALSERAGSR